MTLEYYDPGTSSAFYDSYYREQVGNGVQVYAGRPFMPQQSGSGLGAIFSGLLKAAAPMVKSIGRSVGKRVLETGLNVASDMVDGQNFKSSANKRLKSSGREFLGDLGSGPLFSDGGAPSRQPRQRRKRKAQRGRGLVNGLKSNSIF